MTWKSSCPTWQATAKPVRYIPIPPDARRKALIDHGVPTVIVDALDIQVHERLKGGFKSQVDLSTDRLFGIRPTTFMEFAQRNADLFGKTAAP